MNINPLNILDELANEDLTAVDTSYPVLAAGQYEFRIQEMKQETFDSGWTCIQIKCSLITPGAVDTNNSPVPPGYVITHRIGLSLSEKVVAEIGEEAAKKQVKVNVVKFLQALGDLEFDPTYEKYLGKTFFAKTRVSKQREDKKTGQVYEPQAEFAQFIPAV